jgi:AcrR family transcriptional regulator
MDATVEKKENRRVRYTRMALRESLLSLLQSNPINRITVSRVCDQADVNRSTFYLYYKDAYDLLEKIEEELYEELDSTIAKFLDTLPSVDILRRIYEIIYKNRDLCRVLFGEFGDKAFLSKVGGIARERSMHDWKKLAGQVDDGLLEYLYAYETYTNIGVLERWIARDFPETPEQLAQMVSRLMNNGVSVYLPRH